MNDVRRMSAEELNELNPSDSNPVHLIGIAGPSIVVVSREYGGYWFAADTNGIALGRIDEASLMHYKSKRQRKVTLQRDAWLLKDGSVQMKVKACAKPPHGSKAIVLTAEYWE